MTITSEPIPMEELVELRRQQLERLLQITAHEYDLRFEFGDWDVLGDGEIVLRCSAEEVASARYRFLKGLAVHLLGHYLSDGARWVERARSQEARGQPHFTKLWHSLEDARLENQLIHRWPGMAKSLDSKLPPNLGGGLMKLASRTRQIELGLYLQGRGLSEGQYEPVVAGLLAQASEAIEYGAAGPSPEVSFEAMETIYPLMAPHLRGEMRQAPPRTGDGGTKELDPAEDADRSPRNEQQGPPEIHTDDDLVAVGVLGRQSAFPEWYKPGSAPWFEKGLGHKQVHPSAAQTDRETILIPPLGAPEDYRQLVQEVQAEAGWLTRRLKQRIEEALYLRYGGRFRSGKLDMARLWKQRTGSFRLFQRRVNLNRRDIAFSLLIDESASMKSEGKSHLAAKAAVMVGSALGELGVPLEIIGFTTARYEAQAAMALGLNPPHQYRTMRCSRLEHRLYKRFDEPFSAVARRLTQIQPRHNNWDEEHLQFAFRRLQSQRSDRQVLIVISDGQPNGDADHLIKTVEVISRLGGEVLGVGIGAEFVLDIYPRAVVVSDFKALAEAFVEMIAGKYRQPSTLAA